LKTYSRHDFTREERAARAKVAISDAVAHLGKPEDIGRVFIGVQKYLYQEEARSAGTPLNR
jgi:hypothetical protein